MRAYAVRFAFGAATSLVAGLVTLLHGAVAGGVFLAFPAILAATLTLLEADKGPVAAVGDARGAIAGALGLIAFAAVATVLLRRVQPAAALAAALGAWVVVSLALYVIGTQLAAWLNVERYPPEVPVSFAAPLLEALRQRGDSITVVDAGAGGALAAVLAEVLGGEDVVVGGVVAPDALRAGLMLDCGGPNPTPGEHLTTEMAVAARERWRVGVGLALVSAEGGHLALAETFHVALATRSGTVAHTFQADRGGEGNWGQAVIAALRFACEALAQRASTSSRMPVRSSPSIEMSMNEGTQMRSMPPGAT